MKPMEICWRDRCFKTIFVMAIAAIVTFSNDHRIEAEIVRYSFVESQSNETVATFELDGLPAFGGDIISISFTQFGDDLFGFGSSYNNTFDSDDIALVDDGMDGLQGSNNLNGGQMGDATPPGSSLEVETSNGARIFLIEPTDTLGQDRLAFISVGRGVGGTEIRVRSDGDFRLVSVPEPGTAVIVGLAGLLAIARRRKKLN
jgi:hypothetical protein